MSMLPAATRVLFVACCVCVIAATAGAARADDIPIDNYRLHIECEGEGAPAVILDAGLGGSSLEWVFVRRELGALTRVCSFDRAGYGASDMGPIPRTSSQIANELYLLLDGAGVDGPYILAGHSFGGYNVQLFARRYPYLTAGLVLIDASHPDQVERFLAPPLNMLTAPSSRYGIVQFGDPPAPHAALPDAVRLEISRRAKRWKTRRTLGNELLSFRDSARQVSHARPPADIPLFVITRGKLDGEVNERRMLMERRWLDMQTEMAASSAVSAHLLARAAGHNVHIEQPELVAFSIALLVERWRLRGVKLAARETALMAHDFHRYALTNVAWLHDTLDVYPAAGESHQACVGAIRGGCAGGAP